MNFPETTRFAVNNFVGEMRPIMKIMGLHCGRVGIRGLVCNHNGRILNTARMAVSAENGAIPYLQNIQSLINTLAQSNAGIDCVGIVTSGQTNPQSRPVTKTVIPDSSAPICVPCPSVLDTEVYVENCANAALLGEHWLGAAKKHRDVVLIKLGSEVEFAAMIDGRLQPDAAAERAVCSPRFRTPPHFLRKPVPSSGTSPRTQCLL